MTQQVFVTRQFPGEVAGPLEAAGYRVQQWTKALPPPRDVMLREAAATVGILCSLTERIDAEVIAAAPDLRVISTFAVGVDNIELSAATARGIPVGHTPGVLTEASADLAFALLMAAARRIVEGADYVRAGHWKTWGPQLLLGQEVHGATLGILGMGRIGQAMARRAQGFEMRVLYHSRSRDEAAEAKIGAQWVDFPTLLRESDFLSLHVPLTEATYHLIGAAELAQMKPTAILINTARGPVVDSAALYAALRAGRLAYAALDVTDPEPISMDDLLLTLENCLVVPHIGSAGVATRHHMARIMVENLLAGLRGERLPYCANPEVYA
ncbi:MAG: D-glycerate dehydrogenase [Anaerolineae bacterium]|nr:D-glycerate dehydrogenase [Anaerolineae bacterium]